MNVEISTNVRPDIVVCSSPKGGELGIDLDTGSNSVNWSGLVNDTEVSVDITPNPLGPSAPTTVVINMAWEDSVNWSTPSGGCYLSVNWSGEEGNHDSVNWSLPGHGKLVTIDIS